MDWKLLIVLVFTTTNYIFAHPGVRTPPTELLEKFRNESELILETNDTKITPLLKDGRDFPKAHQNPFLRELNRTTPIPPTLPTPAPLIASRPSMRNDNDDYHSGVAVPLTQEELEKEMNAASIFPSSTAREGLSTWILLSGTATTPQPRRTTTQSMANRKGDKIAKIEKIEKIEQVISKPTTSPTQKPILKPRPKPTPTKNTKKPDEGQHRIESILPKRKKPALENRPNGENKPPGQNKRKSTTTTTTTSTTPSTTSTSTTSTTLAPQTELPSVSEQPVTSTTAETTTFQILEAKDADFDLPQDRSPGSTTKKPRRKNTNKKHKKKNTGVNLKTEIAGKKPPLQVNKDKPLTTKIYNYLAREVMPTVGVGLVGLALTAGLATYFLGTPFGALRRSYDVNERKDDMYYYNNNEEYGGAGGQSEEEVFGKVIAGMPVNSPYRNSIQYSIYRPATNQYTARNPQRFVVAQPQPSQQPQQQIRYRTNDPYYNQYQQSTYSNSRPYESNAQQFYRYNAKDANNFRTNVQSADLQKTFSNYKSDMASNYQSDVASGYQSDMASNYQSDLASNYQSDMASNYQSDMASNYQSEMMNSDTSMSSDPSVKIKIVTPATTTSEVEPITDPSVLDNDVLLRRTQFVVGNVQSGSKDNQASSESPILETVPEHGPRRRRKRETSAKKDLFNKVDENENEIDGPLPLDNKPKVEHTEKPQIVKEQHSTQEPKLEVTKPQHVLTTTPYPVWNAADDMGGMDETTTDYAPAQPLAQNIFSLIRNIFELKVRMGLSFLQNTTVSFGQYLKDVEKRIDESKVFTRHRTPSLF